MEVWNGSFVGGGRDITHLSRLKSATPGQTDERLSENGVLRYQSAWLFKDLLFSSWRQGWRDLYYQHGDFKLFRNRSREGGSRLKVASQLSGFPSYLTLPLNIGPVNCPSLPFLARTGRLMTG